MRHLLSVRAPGDAEAITQRVVVASFAAFLVFGILQALYGPILPLLAHRFHIGISAAEVSLSVNCIGALSGIGAFACGRSRIGDRASVAVSLVCLATGTALMAVVGSWSLFLAASLIAGFGCGGIDYELSVIFASSFGRRSVVMLNALHGMFGLGCVVGTGLLGWFSPSVYPAVLSVIAVVALASLSCMRSLPGPHGKVGPQRRQAPVRGVGAIASGFVLFYVLQIGVEFGIGAWEPQHLQSLSETPNQALFMTSLYWLSLALGRLLVVACGGRLSARPLAVVCTAGTTVCLIGTMVPALAAPAYALAGFCLGPLFPTGLAWIAEVVPDAGALSAWVIGLSWVGGIVFPFALGIVIGQFGFGVLPVGLAVLALSCAATTIWVSRLEQRQRAAASVRLKDNRGADRGLVQVAIREAAGR